MHYDAKPLEYCEEETKSFAKKILIYNTRKLVLDMSANIGQF